MLVQGSINGGFRAILVPELQLSCVNQDRLHMLMFLEIFDFAILGPFYHLLPAVITSLDLILRDREFIQKRKFFGFLDQPGNLMVENHLLVYHLADYRQHLLFVVAEVPLSLRNGLVGLDDHVHDFQAVDGLDLIFGLFQLEVPLVELREGKV